MHIAKDEKIKAGYLKEHIDSVRGHLYDKKKGLINKDYIKIYGLKSFQKVIVFFPSDNLLGILQTIFEVKLFKNLYNIDKDVEPSTS